MFLKPIFFLFSFSLCSGLNPKDFCQVKEREGVGMYGHKNKYEVAWRLEKCSERNAPHIYQCDENTCTKNQTECKKYLSLKEKLKVNFLKLFSEMMFLSPKKNHGDYKLERYFFKLQASIKICMKKPYHLKLSEVCIRGRNCFQIIETTWFKMLFSKINEIRQINCPCHGNHTFLCGSDSEYCTVNKEACDSYMNKNYFKHLKENQQDLGIKRCEID